MVEDLGQGFQAREGQIDLTVDHIDTQLLIKGHTSTDNTV